MSPLDIIVGTICADVSGTPSLTEDRTIRSEPTTDVVLAADLRRPDAASAALAEEALAQSRAGYSTRLLHVPAADLEAARPFSPRLADLVRAGITDFVAPSEPIRARLLVVRGSTAVEAVAASATDDRFDEVVVVVDAEDDAAALPAARTAAQRLPAGRVRWMPTDPFVRAQVDAAASDVPLETDDWRPVIDVDRWASDRSRFVGDRPVVGCLGRDDLLEWPGTAADVLAATPQTEGAVVRVLGDAATASVALGERAKAVEVVDPNGVSTLRFLRMIDLFVCFPHAGREEACERPILEALASGAVTILSPRLAGVYGDAAVYCPPWEMRSLIADLWSDPARFAAQSSRGRRVARDRFGPRAHERRLRSLVGPPSPDRPGADRTAGRRPAVTAGVRHAARPIVERMLFVSSNGAGLGHLTRLMAVARRLPEGYEAVFATQSQAVQIVRDEGYRTEYIPSNPYLGSDAPRWNQYLRRRLDELLASYDPGLVLVDAPVPYSGMLGSMATHEHVSFVWLRRPMWRQGLGAEWLQRGVAYDEVVEPGEFAAAVDTGPTVGRVDATPVDPIVYLDDDDLLDRDQACAELGLDPNRPAALIQLGAGNINDNSSDVAIVAERLRREQGLQVVLAQSPISVQHVAVPEGLRTVQVFPISRWLRAFDLTVSAAGYNSYHELIRFGVPTLFVPNIRTQLDDQVARALFAQDEGVALCVQRVTRESADRALSTLLDPAARQEIRVRCLERRLPNGARAAADAVVAASGRRGRPVDAGRPGRMRKTA